MKNDDYSHAKNAVLLDLVHSLLSSWIVYKPDYIDSEELRDVRAKIHDWAAAAYDEVLKDE
jgi:hypothetical protein